MSTWWHVYPLGFAGADTTGADRSGRSAFEHLARWLDHAAELGIDGLALGPVFRSGTHGYDTIDHYAVDERLGTDDELVALCDAAHDRGLRVLLDGVFNHVGRDFPRFHAADADPCAPAAAWFRREGDGWSSFEGHGALVTLDHDNPEVQAYVVDVMRHWLARGADGWRLDAAYAVPTSFWSTVLPQVRASAPGCVLLGEVLHGDYAAFVEQSTVDTVTQYELWKAIWSSLHDQNFFELAWALKRHDAFLDSFVPYTFLGNHDVTRLASQIGDPRHRAHAVVVLMTVGGDPAVYYGDELGWTGVKEDRIGGDDAVRPAFPASPADADLSDDQLGTLALHRELIRLRRDHPWLRHAQVREIALANKHFVYEAAHDGQVVRVALNLDEHALCVGIDGHRVVAGQADLHATTASVPAHGWAVLAC